MRSPLIGLLALSTSLAAAAVPDAEFIRVAPDHWSFETASTHVRFVPFGTNFVLNEKRYLNLFGPGVYDHRLYDDALAGLEALGMNIVKVFLPIAEVLPDPQVPGAVHIAPGYLDNLDKFLTLARRHHIRVVVTLTSWGGNGITWWHDGGEYFGRRPWKTTAGIDSLDVLARFWTMLATRFRDNPTVFSYNVAVEWSFPAGNLTWTPPNKQYGRLETPQGIFYWRAFLAARYKQDIAALNRAYQSHYTDFREVPIVDFTYQADRKRYVSPDAMVLDYQNFREWASRRYFRPQIAAIRAADPNHMVTIGNHSRRAIGLWPGAARYFIGFSPPEQADLVDYLTTHDNHSVSHLKPAQGIEYVVHSSIVRTRFCCARKLLPVIIEEYTFASPDPQQTAAAQKRMVEGTIGHASGWMNWYLQYPHDANSADMKGKDRSAILDDALKPTPWGKTVPELARSLNRADLSRKQPARVVPVDRTAALVPKTMGMLLRICADWDAYPHPLDFQWPPNPWIDLPLQEDR